MRWIARPLDPWQGGDNSSKRVQNLQMDPQHSPKLFPALDFQGVLSKVGNHY